MDAKRPRRKKPKQKPPFDVNLEAQKDTRVGMNLFRPEGAIELGPNTRFVVIPGERGKGWRMRVYPDPEPVEG